MDQDFGESCNGCTLVPVKAGESVEYVPDLSLSLVRCTACYKCRGIILDESAAATVSISDALEKMPREIKEDGWVEATELEDRRILCLLIQISNNQQDLGIEFSLPPISDTVKILWEGGHPIGFYSVKPKGTFDLETMICYSMPTLDTIFIRKHHRRRGFALTALQSLRTDFPLDKIAFSYPLTLSMRQVLWKHLKETPEDRIRFWELLDPWGESRNVWLTLKRQNQNHGSHINSL